MSLLRNDLAGCDCSRDEVCLRWSRELGWDGVGGIQFELRVFLGKQALMTGGTGSEKNLAQLEKCVLPLGLEKKVHIF